MKFEIASVDSLIVYFSQSISEDTAKQIRLLYQSLKENMPLGIIELTPSYTTLLVRFDIFVLSHESLKSLLKDILKTLKSGKEDKEEKILEIPVLYDTHLGLDLEELAQEKKLSIQEIIDLHAKHTYRVYALGFLPGFAYMGSVDKKLASPRHKNPRGAIPKGSVGIAGEQTAIYPKQSPGGWKILGRTPIELFSKSYEGFSYMHVGDKVRFIPIDKEEFLRLGGVYDRA